MPELRDLAPQLTTEEYLEDEKNSEIRHEYINGEVYAMSGGTRDHNRISGNIFSFLDDALHGGHCKPYINDVKVHIKSLQNETFYYPDIVVTCDPEDNNELYVEKPTTVVEVLSDSTEATDKREKFFAYRTLPNLEEYVLVSQKEKQITIARKANQWRAEYLSGDEFELKLSCCSTSIPSSRIYRGTKLG